MLSIFALLALSSQIPVTKWKSPDPSEHPLRYSEWIAAHPESPLKIVKIEQIGASKSDSVVAVIVDSATFDADSIQIENLLSQLESEGFTVEFVVINGGTPEALRTLLTEFVGLDGAIFIGDVPVAWFQLIDDWNGNGVHDPEDSYEEFPCDLFFMDLDGQWFDLQMPQGDSLVSGSDGIYDTHLGDVEPEIWVSRIYPNQNNLDDSLIADYIERDLRFRNGQADLPAYRALAFIDDDWIPYTAGFVGPMFWLFYDIIVENHPETTDASHYRRWLSARDTLVWVSVFAHSSPHYHAFKINSGTSWSYFQANQLQSIRPDALFYNLFACSNARFVEQFYMAGMYVFSTAHGLAAIGSTKSGSMLEFDQFYMPLADSISIGDAFLSWFQSITHDGTNSLERSWFYGMCLIGDGTINPTKHYLLNIVDAATPHYQTPDVHISFDPVALTLSIAVENNIDGKIEIYDVAGRRVISTQFFSSKVIDLSNLASGIYIVKLETGERHLSPKTSKILVIK